MQTTSPGSLPELPPLTISEASEVFSRHRRWVVHLIESGALPATKDANGVWTIEPATALTVMRLRGRGHGVQPKDPADFYGGSK